MLDLVIDEDFTDSLSALGALGRGIVRSDGARTAKEERQQRNPGEGGFR